MGNRFRAHYSLYLAYRCHYFYVVIHTFQNETPMALVLAANRVITRCAVLRLTIHSIRYGGGYGASICSRLLGSNLWKEYMSKMCCTGVFLGHSLLDLSDQFLRLEIC